MNAVLMSFVGIFTESRVKDPPEKRLYRADKPGCRHEQYYPPQTVGNELRAVQRRDLL